MQKKILMVWPPEVPTSANSFTYHYIDFIEPLSYLINKGYQVDFIDLGILNIYKQELYIKLLSLPSKVVIYADIHMKNEALFVYEITKRISPNSEILIYGPLSTYYKNDLLKNVSCKVSGIGDYETIIHKFTEESNNERIVNGNWLNGNDIIFPNLDYFDPFNYQRLLDLDRNRKQSLNIGLSVSRGCTYKCSYCRLTIEENYKDRRVSINSLVKYIKDTKDKHSIKYFKFLSPNFAFDKKWCLEFVKEIKKLEISWKCCTRPEYFQDLNLVKEFKEAGCKSISVGLEVFTSDDYKIIGRNSNIDKSIAGIKNLISHGISVKCLVMLGVPGVSDDNVKKGAEYVESIGAVIRPSLYTDYSKISWNELEYSDKRTPIHAEHQNSFLMELVYDRKGKMF